MKINHEADFMNTLVKTKERLGSDVTLLEWDSNRNRWSSDVVEAAWNGYCMAINNLVDKGFDL